jgi:hypothetical protein
MQIDLETTVAHRPSGLQVDSLNSDLKATAVPSGLRVSLCDYFFLGGV